MISVPYTTRKRWMSLLREKFCKKGEKIAKKCYICLKMSDKLTESCY